jgi:NitT/TauT family transport system ATP-binding protein
MSTSGAAPHAPAAAHAQQWALDLENINLSFAVEKQAAHVVLRELNLRVAAGEFVCVVGPTGCGKSTLLNVAAGLLSPSSGSVRVFGEVLNGINRRAGYLFQSDALLPWRTALDNVATGLTFRGVALPEARSQAQQWLARVGLSGFGDRYPHQLSGGMRKRVALAQVLVLDPKLMLMDEPFSALDVQTRGLMENQLLELWSARTDGRSPGCAYLSADGRSPGCAYLSADGQNPGGASVSTDGRSPGCAYPSTDGRSPGCAHPHDRKSVVFITHDLEEAIALADRVVLLSAGPGSSIIGEYAIDLPRPRDVAEIRLEERFLTLHREIWHALRDQVQRALSLAPTK